MFSFHVPGVIRGEFYKYSKSAHQSIKVSRSKSTINVAIRILMRVKLKLILAGGIIYSRMAKKDLKWQLASK